MWLFMMSPKSGGNLAPSLCERTAFGSLGLCFAFVDSLALCRELSLWQCGLKSAVFRITAGSSLHRGVVPSTQHRHGVGVGGHSPPSPLPGCEVPEVAQPLHLHAASHPSGTTVPARTCRGDDERGLSSGSSLWDRDRGERLSCGCVSTSHWASESFPEPTVFPCPASRCYCSHHNNWHLPLALGAFCSSHHTNVVNCVSPRAWLRVWSLRKHPPARSTAGLTPRALRKSTAGGLHGPCQPAPSPPQQALGSVRVGIWGCSCGWGKGIPCSLKKQQQR